MNSRTKSRNAQEPKPAKEFAFRGLWRDGKYLVVDLTSHHFPRRCLLSNQPVESPPEPTTLICHNAAFLEIERLESDRRQTGDTKFRIVRAPKSRTRVELEMRLPLTPRWQRLKQSPLGIRLILGAVATFLFLFAGQFIVRRLEMSGVYLALWTWVTCVLLLISGLLVQWLQSLILPVHRLEERKVWLAGVHRDWLKDLPEFTPSRGMLERSSRLLLWRKWTSLGLCLALWLLAVLAWFTTSPPDKTTTAVIFVLAAVSLAAALLVVYSHSEAERQKRRLGELYPERRRKRPKR